MIPTHVGSRKTWLTDLQRRRLLNRLEFLPQAKAELTDAVNYYESELNGL